MHADAAQHGIHQGVSELCEQYAVMTGVAALRDQFGIPVKKGHWRNAKQRRDYRPWRKA
jgi:hypothetical protein